MSSAGCRYSHATKFIIEIRVRICSYFSFAFSVLFVCSLSSALLANVLIKQLRRLIHSGIILALKLFVQLVVDSLNYCCLCFSRLRLVARSRWL